MSAQSKKALEAGYSGGSDPLVVLPMAFPERLVSLRKSKKLTQRTLADAIGLHVVQVRRYEAGTSQPTLDVLRNLALTFGVTVDELVFDEVDRDLDDQLKMRLQTISKFDDEEKRIIKAILDGMILKHEAKRWSAP